MILTAMQSGFWHWWTIARGAFVIQSVGLLATVTALTFTYRLLGGQLKQFRQADEDRKQAKEQEQSYCAERVVAWISGALYNSRSGTNMATYHVKNAGDRPVFGCEVVGLELGNYEDPYQKTIALHNVIAPGEIMRTEVQYVGPQNKGPAVEIHFVDPSDVHWSRDASGKLKRTPVEHALTNKAVIAE